MFGPDVDPTFESILDSLARIAQKQPKPVVDCIMRWRKSEADKPLSNDAMRQHVCVAFICALSMNHASLIISPFQQRYPCEGTKSNRCRGSANKEEGRESFNPPFVSPASV
jgi:hypothetical protein